MRAMITIGLAVLLVGTAAADTPPKSGPAVGAELPGPFSPKHINGESAGKEECLV